MKSSFCIDLQRFMLIPTKFPLTHIYLYAYDALANNIPHGLTLKNNPSNLTLEGLFYKMLSQADSNHH